MTFSVNKSATAAATAAARIRDSFCHTSNACSSNSGGCTKTISSSSNISRSSSVRVRVGVSMLGPPMLHYCFIIGKTPAALFAIQILLVAYMHSVSVIRGGSGGKN